MRRWAGQAWTDHWIKFWGWSFWKDCVFAQDVGYTFSSHRDDSSVLSIADPKEWFFLPANHLDWVSVSQCLYELSGTAALAPRRVGKPGRSPLHLHRVEKLAVCRRYLITPSAAIHISPYIMCWLSIQAGIPGPFWITITLLFTSPNQGEDRWEISTVFVAHCHSSR
jgi:hypothetical protein